MNAHQRQLLFHSHRGLTKMYLLHHIMKLFVIFFQFSSKALRVIPSLRLLIIISVLKLVIAYFKRLQVRIMMMDEITVSTPHKSLQIDIFWFKIGKIQVFDYFESFTVLSHQTWRV